MEDPELTPSHRQNKSTDTYGIISSENILKTKHIVPPQQRQRNALAKNLILCVTTQVVGISKVQNFSLRSEGFGPHIMHPNAWVLHWTDEPKMFGFENE